MDPDKPRSMSPATAFKAIMVEQAGAMSEPPAVKQSRLQTEAAVDIFTIAMLTLLLVTKSVPGWEPHALGAIVLIGGGAQALQAMGKRGGAVTALAGGLPWVLKAMAARIVMVLPLAFMLSCATLAALGTSALQALAPVAVDAIKAALANDPETKCVELADEYQPDQSAVVTCVGEDINAAIDPAGEALNAQAAADGETIDPRTALCEPVDADGVPGAVVVCGAMYAEDDE